MAEEALGAADRALARCRKLDEQWYVPELLRLRGEALLLRGQPTAAAEAETAFHTALRLAPGTNRASLGTGRSDKPRPAASFAAPNRGSPGDAGANLWPPLHRRVRDCRSEDR